MKHYRIILFPLILIMMMSIVTGCTKTTGVGGLSNTKSVEKAGDNELAISVEGTSYPLTVKDSLSPQLILPVHCPPLNIWYDLGGKSICTSDVSNNVKLIPEYEDEIKSLPSIGPVYSIDMESVISHQPDLIIAQVGTQSTQAKKFRDMGFDVITTHIRGYDDVISTYRAFGKILENEKLAESKIDELERKKEEIVAKLPNEKKSVVILYITSKTIAVKLDNSIAGDVANILKLDNIASDLPADTIGSETTPLDIEYIVEKDPDYVLVTSMIGSNELAKKLIEEEFANNPAWKGVTAIQKGRVAHLPQEYFLYNAGPYYDEAIEYMAEIIYPEIYKGVTQ